MGLKIQSSPPKIATSTRQADVADWRRLIKVIGFTVASWTPTRSRHAER